MVVVVAPHRLPQGQGLALETRAGVGGSASTTSAYLFLPAREWRSGGAVRPHLQSTAAVRATAQQQANGNCRALLSLALPAHQWRQGPPFSLWCPQSQGKGGIRGGLGLPGTGYRGLQQPPLATFFLFARPMCQCLMGALLTDSGRANGTVPGWPIRGPHGLRRGARLAGISQSARRRSLFGDSSLYV